MNKFFLLLFSILIISCKPNKDYDLLIYGGTSAGVIAAYSAAQLDKKVVLVVPGTHIGGLTSGGLGMTDIGNKNAVTGIARQFYRKTGAHYGKFEQWRFEPHVASQVFEDYLNHKNITVIQDHWIDSVHMEGQQIISATFFDMKNKEETQSISAFQFIDCSYEGDFMAKSGVSYTVGREPNHLYNENYNGVQLLPHKHQFEVPVSPYLVPGDPDSGLLPGITAEELQRNGTEDYKVQAYNFRLCLTQDKNKQIPFYKPDYYNPLEYELLARLLKTRHNWRLRDLLILSGMPNGKTDVNNKGPISTDYIGRNWEYPEADYEKRMQITKMHEDYIKGYLYFLANDKRVPDNLQQEAKSWGYAADEFTENRGFPTQMYVREARRMIGEYVMTEHNCLGDSVVTDGIGKAAYGMDSHYCQRVIIDGQVKNEGNINVEDFPPYPIAYRSITPKRSECTNLLVPVALSASHIAYGSIRMEPVFMVLGQSAAVAASLAIDQNNVVQEVDVANLQQMLGNNPYLNGQPGDLLLDDSNPEKFTTHGEWKLIERNAIPQPYKGTLHFTEKTGDKKAIYKDKIEKAGVYRAYVYHPIVIGYKQPYSAKTVFIVKTPVGQQEITINFAEMPINQNWGEWASLDSFVLQKGDEISITLEGSLSQPPLVADAIMLVWQEPN